MSFQKESISANLYGLRAGLSVIAIECDKIKAAERKVEQATNDLSRKRNEIESREREAKLSMDIAAESVHDTRRNFIIALIGAVVFVTLTIICLINFISLANSPEIASPWHLYLGLSFSGLIISIIAIISSFSWREEAPTFLYVLFILLMIAGGFIGLVCFFGMLDDDKYPLKGSQITKNCGFFFAGVLLFGLVAIVLLIIQFVLFCKLTKRVKEYKSLKSTAATETQRAERAMAVNEKGWASIDEWRIRAIAPCVGRIKSMYALLKNNFNMILDERDWQYLDLIIYQLETRRADNIKEALQLVDREIQTQRIENLICNATKTITYTLNAGFSSLRETLAIVYNGLSQQIQGLSSQISGLSTQMVNSTVMNQALLNKMNVSSTQMVSDMQAIRNNSEYMKMRLT